jgi:methylenetetrahydrofolate dehydrogenase (NADP+)/methenyltetrahydrofolate cyclohydrolase
MEVPVTARILDGNALAQEKRAEIAAAVAELKAERDVVPGLATVIVGANPASVSYVTSKQRSCVAAGMRSLHHELPADVSQADLLALIDAMNADPAVDGILVQLPLPKHIDEQAVLLRIDPGKDVDGFHPVNLGKLVIGNADFPPCTPAGIQEILVRSGVALEGADVVVVGRSNIVGKPVANLLLQKGPGANATVTVVHTKTRDVAAHTRRADVLIVAAGVARYVTADMVKPGAVVIDVGVNRIGTTASGKAKLCGDVDFEAVKEVASAITPVPGGVGPMTITMLLANTLKAARLHHG